MGLGLLESAFPFSEDAVTFVGGFSFFRLSFTAHAMNVHQISQLDYQVISLSFKKQFCTACEMKAELSYKTMTISISVPLVLSEIACLLTGKRIIFFYVCNQAGLPVQFSCQLYACENKLFNKPPFKGRKRTCTRAKTVSVIFWQPCALDACCMSTPDRQEDLQPIQVLGEYGEKEDLSCHHLSGCRMNFYNYMMFSGVLDKSSQIGAAVGRRL